MAMRVKKLMSDKFEATIYKVGINLCVDVPKAITDIMKPHKGYIKVKGNINGFKFSKNLVPVKDSPYRLFVNIPMLKGGNTGLGETAEFEITQDFSNEKKNYPVPDLLRNELKEKRLEREFNNLTDSRKNEILKYLNYLKTEKTLKKQIEKLIGKLERNEKNIRIP